MSRTKGTVAVDLDGTLAIYNGFKSIYNIGEPVQNMLDRVWAWRAEKRKVVIFTARVAPRKDGTVNDQIIKVIEDWCLKHIGEVLPVTCMKTTDIVEIWDDRAIQVVLNTGERVGTHERN